MSRAVNEIISPDGAVERRYFLDGREVDRALFDAEPDAVDEFRKAVQAATSVADLKEALLGTSGPGAEPRRGSA